MASAAVSYASAALERMPGRQLLVPHIAKTGGTAVISMLRSVSPPLNLSGMGTGRPLDLRSDVVILHLPDSLPRVLRGAARAVAILAVVRDPVERVLSEFLFMRGRHASAFVPLTKSLDKPNVSWEEWAAYPKARNFQLAYLRGYGMFSHVTTRRDWEAWVEEMAQVPVVLLRMEAINSLLPAILEYGFPGRVVRQRTPVGRWGRGFGVSAANASRLSAKTLVPLPNQSEREAIRRLNWLDEQLFQLASNHTAAYASLLLNDYSVGTDEPPRIISTTPFH